MKKFFTLVVAAMAAFCASADELVYDTLTVQNLNVDTSKGSYAEYTATLPSGAEYYAYTMANPQKNEAGEVVGYNIQLRGNKKNPYSGIVVTKSAGVLREVIFNWSNNTNNSRTIDVFGSENPFVNANCLHPDSTGRAELELVTQDSLIYNADKELVFSGSETCLLLSNPTYFGICMDGTTAAYFSSIIIGWGSEDTNAIERVNVQAVKNEQIYNLKGEAVKKMTSGMYVKEGRKIFVR